MIQCQWSNAFIKGSVPYRAKFCGDDFSIELLLDARRRALEVMGAIDHTVVAMTAESAIRLLPLIAERLHAWPHGVGAHKLLGDFFEADVVTIMYGYSTEEWRRRGDDFPYPFPMQAAPWIRR